MKENPENNTGRKRRFITGRPLVIAAAVLAVIQACLTIEGMGIEGFLLWVIILFFGYWLLFNGVIWLWGRYKDRG